MGMLTLLIFGVGGALIIHFGQERPIGQVVWGRGGWWWQLGAGLVVGTLMGWLAWLVASSRVVKPAIMRYVVRIGPLMERPADRLFISVCAGVGEELFFRGMVQHWLGIPLTAVLFVAIHGYLDPRNWRLCLYGLALTVIMVVLGLWAEVYGLLGPIAAHAAIDVVLLWQLRQEWCRSEEAERNADQTCG